MFVEDHLDWMYEMVGFGHHDAGRRIERYSTETHCRGSVKLCRVIINRKDQISMSGVDDILRSRGAQIPGPRTVWMEGFADRCMPKF